MNEISENTLNEELNRIFLVKNSVQRKLYSTEYNMEIQNLERRNSEYALFESQRELESQRRQLLEANQSKWHDNSELSFLGDASGKIPSSHGISELDCKLPMRGLLEDKEFHARFAVDHGNRSSQIAG